MTQHVSLTGLTEVETQPCVSNRLCHAEPQDSENVKEVLLISWFYSIVLMPTLCPLSLYYIYLIFSFFYKIILEGSGLMGQLCRFYLCKYTLYVSLALEVGNPLH